MEGNRTVHRSIVAYKSYFHDFIVKQNKDVARKYNSVFRYICTQPQIPIKFFRSIQNIVGLYEIRVEVSGNIFRTFCCLDEGKIVVLFNSFHKKSQKNSEKQNSKSRKDNERIF